MVERIVASFNAGQFKDTDAFWCYHREGREESGRWEGEILEAFRTELDCFWLRTRETYDTRPVIDG